jgi:hypothetical protein
MTRASCTVDDLADPPTKREGGGVESWGGHCRTDDEVWEEGEHEGDVTLTNASTARAMRMTVPGASGSIWMGGEADLRDAPRSGVDWDTGV